MNQYDIMNTQATAEHLKSVYLSIANHFQHRLADLLKLIYALVDIALK